MSTDPDLVELSALLAQFHEDYFVDALDDPYETATDYFELQLDAGRARRLAVEIDHLLILGGDEAGCRLELSRRGILRNAGGIPHFATWLMVVRDRARSLAAQEASGTAWGPT